MKKQYDFSKGERGKFYSKDARFNIPVYLEHDTYIFVEKLASKKHLDISTVVNDLLKNDEQLMKYTE